MNGTLLTTYQYDPYGNLTSSTGSVANPWRFAGGYFDSSTGLYKFGTRYYNPGFGRWSQQDLVRGHLADPTSLNRYLYAGDDPVNFTDPSGAETLFDAVASCLIGVITGFLTVFLPWGIAEFLAVLLPLLFEPAAWPSVGAIVLALIVGCIVGVFSWAYWIQLHGGNG